ncbi:unnamed protein product [Ranitomeya imitator]|uniref:Uncharacterized protein n=1 Tax=Ranitomeya imitator TaxID=111125 RepID=A0ABN9LIN0_9NEOB|nr:unnamed protein product [Ranitomeya imitator]
MYLMCHGKEGVPTLEIWDVLAKMQYRDRSRSDRIKIKENLDMFGVYELVMTWRIIMTEHDIVKPMMSFKSTTRFAKNNPSHGHIDGKIKSYGSGKKRSEKRTRKIPRHGHHLVLLLSQRRNIWKQCLPLSFQASMSQETWEGTALIPWEYFPPSVDRFNAFAIHGSGPKRTYEALYPIPEKEVQEGQQPDLPLLMHPMILFALAAAAWHWLLQDIVPVYQIKGISKLFKLCLPKVQCFCDSLTSPPSERQLASPKITLLVSLSPSLLGHRLEYFRPFNFQVLMGEEWKVPASSLWKISIEILFMPTSVVQIMDFKT